MDIENCMGYTCVNIFSFLLTLAGRGLEKHKCPAQEAARAGEVKGLEMGLIQMNGFLIRVALH
jgi:hypothetical protein